MDELITLVGETFAADNIGRQRPVEKLTEVWAHIKSVSRAEFFRAGAAGLQPRCVAETHAANWSGEQIVIRNGTRYGVYRTYFPDGGDTVELYLETKAGVTHGQA